MFQNYIIFHINYDLKVYSIWRDLLRYIANIYQLFIDINSKNNANQRPVAIYFQKWNI